MRYDAQREYPSCNQYLNLGGGGSVWNGLIRAIIGWGRTSRARALVVGFTVGRGRSLWVGHVVTLGRNWAGTNIRIVATVSGNRAGWNSGRIVLRDTVLGNVALWSVAAGSVVLGSVVLGSVVLGSVVLGSVVLGSVVLGSVVLGSVVLRDAVLGDIVGGDRVDEIVAIGGERAGGIGLVGAGTGGSWRRDGLVVATVGRNRTIGLGSRAIGGSSVRPIVGGDRSLWVGHVVTLGRNRAGRNVRVVSAVGGDRAGGDVRTVLGDTVIGNIGLGSIILGTRTIWLGCGSLGSSSVRSVIGGDRSLWVGHIVALGRNWAGRNVRVVATIGGDRTRWDVRTVLGDTVLGDTILGDTILRSIALGNAVLGNIVGGGWVGEIVTIGGERAGRIGLVGAGAGGSWRRDGLTIAAVIWNGIIWLGRGSLGSSSVGSVVGGDRSLWVGHVVALGRNWTRRNILVVAAVGGDRSRRDVLAIFGGTVLGDVVRNVTLGSIALGNTILGNIVGGGWGRDGLIVTAVIGTGTIGFGRRTLGSSTIQSIVGGDRTLWVGHVVALGRDWAGRNVRVVAVVGGDRSRRGVLAIFGGTVLGNVVRNVALGSIALRNTVLRNIIGGAWVGEVNIAIRGDRARRIGLIGAGTGGSWGRGRLVMVALCRNMTVGDSRVRSIARGHMTVGGSSVGSIVGEG